MTPCAHSVDEGAIRLPCSFALPLSGVLSPAKAGASRSRLAAPPVFSPTAAAMSGRQEPALSPAYAHVTTPSDLWERTGRVTLCGPTGQLHALAILESFALDFEAAELPPEVRAQFGPACLLFHGESLLAAARLRS